MIMPQSPRVKVSKANDPSCLMKVPIGIYTLLHLIEHKATKGS